MNTQLQKPNFQGSTRTQTSTTPEQEDNVECYPGANPKCPQCKGAGFVHPIKEIIATPEGDMRIADYSRIVPCSYKGCVKDISRAAKIEKQVEEVSNLKSQTFNTFTVLRGTEDAFRAAKQFALLKSEFIFLLIVGGLGCGKTHLCKAAASTLAYKGNEVKYRKVSELLGDLKKAMDDNTTEKLIEEYQRVQILVLDDYEVERTTIWGDSEIERIIDFRYEAVMPTMLTTNANLEELDTKVGRLQSRFADTKCSLTVVNRGIDFRKGMK